VLIGAVLANYFGCEKKSRSSWEIFAEFSSIYFALNKQGTSSFRNIVTRVICKKIVNYNVYWGGFCDKLLSVNVKSSKHLKMFETICGSFSRLVSQTMSTKES
jgi:uncharacterized membrane-anchored protein YjiN (DUF445 family)